MEQHNGRPLSRCCVILMEYCAYGTLLAALQMSIFRLPDGSTDVGSVCFILLEIASALAHIHSLGIIHCDLKPQNVLLKADDCDPRGFVTKLADFGLARVVSGDLPLLHGDSAGTPSHLAPEIVKMKGGESIKTPKADVFAFGVLMWEMYTSQQAFAEFDQNDVLLLIIQGKRLPYPPDADPAYVSLCQRCWAADVDVRPSLRVLQEELRAITRAHIAFSQGAALANAPAPLTEAPPAAAAAVSPDAMMQSCPSVPAAHGDKTSNLRSAVLSMRLAEAAEKLSIDQKPVPVKK